MRLSTRVGRTVRLARAASRALLDRHHPLLVHLVPMRRCSLSCAYCNEFDAVSKPVSLEVLQARLGRIAELGTAAVTFSGGEPMLHPDLDAAIRHGRRLGMLVGLDSNGHHISPERIAALNQAGLDHLEISIDNLEPDGQSTKSLRLIEPKLRWLAETADFTVAIGSALGAGATSPEDALVVAKRARELGLLTTLGIVQDVRGQLRALEPRDMRVYDELRRFGRRGLRRLDARFQDKLARGLPNDWSCRAGARYLYVDEHGIVHYCSQQRGRPAIPLDDYTIDDIRREYDARKPCAPFCTVSCVQQISIADSWRSPQSAEATLHGHPPAPPAPDEAVAG
jgi:MoaA/NifB/PqqE/SkfB family radical SAM enzyme